MSSSTPCTGKQVGHPPLPLNRGTGRARTGWGGLGRGRELQIRTRSGVAPGGGDGVAGLRLADHHVATDPPNGASPANRPRVMERQSRAAWDSVQSRISLYM